jgi:5-oxoprolinase (ATP-hydrolysing)
MSHELSTSFIHMLSSTTMDDIRRVFTDLKTRCDSTMKEALDNPNPALVTVYGAALRYKGQALELSIELSESDLSRSMEAFEAITHEKFDQIHQQQFSYTLENFPLEVTRLTITVTDGSHDIEIPRVPKAASSTPPESAVLEKKKIVYQGIEHDAVFWDRAAITQEDIIIQGPAVIVEMDSNTLIAPGFEAVIDSVGNICITPTAGNELPSFKSKFESTVSDKTQEERDAEARKTVEDIPTIPTLISSSLASIRAEMDTLMLRCSMSPAIREQQDEFNVITDAAGKMLVGQFGSFIGQFMKIWAYKVGKGEVDEVEEGDVFITNDVYEVEGAVSHLNDIIILLPIYYEHKLVGWAANFGHMTVSRTCFAARE